MDAHPDPHLEAIEAHHGAIEAYLATMEAHHGAMAPTLEPWRLILKLVRFTLEP